MYLLRLFLILLTMLPFDYSFALRFSLPQQGENMVGTLQFTQVQQGETFSQIAERYDVGFLQLLAANPYVRPEHLKVGTVLLVPSQFVLPESEKNGIVIDLSSMRLFYFPKKKSYFYTYPIGIGRENWETPRGLLKIIQKIKNPSWIVPDSIRIYRAKKHDPVPKVMPPGPDNPLGEFAMRLSKPTYLIHGTNEPASVGQRSSAGCIHLYAKDIRELFSMTPIKTAVFITKESALIGRLGKTLYLEIPLPEKDESKDAVLNLNSFLPQSLQRLVVHPAVATIDWQHAELALKQHLGFPRPVGEIVAPELSVTSDVETSVDGPK